MLIESDTWRCARRTAARQVIRGKRRDLACDEVFFGTDTVAGGESLGDQESVGRNAQAGMMVEAAPAASFVMTQPQFLFEFLVVALRAPSGLSRRARAPL